MQRGQRRRKHQHGQERKTENHVIHGSVCLFANPKERLCRPVGERARDTQRVCVCARACVRMCLCVRACVHVHIHTHPNIHTKDETNKDTRNRRRQTRAHHANTAEAANVPAVSINSGTASLKTSHVKSTSGNQTRPATAGVIDALKPLTP